MNKCRKLPNFTSHWYYCMAQRILKHIARNGPHQNTHIKMFSSSYLFLFFCAFLGGPPSLIHIRRNYVFIHSKWQNCFATNERYLKKLKGATKTKLRRGQNHAKFETLCVQLIMQSEYRWSSRISARPRARWHKTAQRATFVWQLHTYTSHLGKKWGVKKKKA